MNARRSLALLVILASLLLPIGDARAQAAEVHVSPTLLRQVAFEERGKRPEMRVIVSFDTPGSRDVVPEPSAVSSARAAILARLPANSFAEVASFDRIRAVSLKVNAESLEILRRTPGVIAINADREVRTSMAQANALTGANIIHGLGYTGEGQVVAIIDTGVDINGGVVHPALADDLVGQACFRTENDCIGGPTSAEDQEGHGTHVAGIITGPEGVAPDARFYALKAFTTGSTSDTNILNALDYVIGLNTATPGAVDLVNMSLGGGNYATGAACDADGVAYVNAFAALNAQGTAIFVATGNDAQTNEISSPGCITGAIGVGSTGESTFTQVFGNCIDNGEPDKVSCFSNATSAQGPGELVDLLAPGCSITSTGLDGSTNYTLCGTSMATPYAAGVAALVRGFMAGAGLGATPAQLEDLLEVTGKPVLDYRIAASPQYPRVDPVAAIGALSFAAPPSGFAITGTTATSISMAWAGVPEATAYRVYRNVPGAAPVQVGSTTVPTVTFTDTSAPCGPQTYFVRAFNGTALSLASNEDTGTARACPLTPTSLLATLVSSTAVTLSWNDSNPNETAQILQRSLNDGAYTDYQTLAPGSALSFAETGLPCGVYRYRAIAERGGDRSAPSNVVQFAACAPANDNFANAEVIAANVAFTDVEANVSFASEEASDPVYSCKVGGPGPGFQGIWYRITPTVATRVTVSTAGTTLSAPGSVGPDTLAAIYTHDGSTFTPIACNDDIGGSNFRSSVTSNLAAGTTYYVFISQWSPVPPGTVGNVSTQFSWSAPLVVPDNDLVANARVIGAMPYTNTVTGAQNATISPTDLPHSCAFSAGGSISPRVGSHTLWWTFTPATDGLLDVDTLASSGSFGDTIMTVYRGAPGSFTEVACNDDEPAPGTTLRSEILDLPLTAGTQYTIYVSRWSNTPTATAGTVVLNASFDPCGAISFPYTLPDNAPATLVRAIECANANGASADTIDLNGQTVTLTTSFATTAFSNIGLPQINTPITIQNGTITRNSTELFRFFLNTSTLTLNNLSLSNADSQSDGGAINNGPSAVLNISNSRLVGNFGNFGGAIFNSNTATATLTNTLVSGNRSNSQGGGIRNRGTLVLNNSTVAGNFTTATTEGGGGIANAGSFSLTLNNSIVAGNEASNFPAANDIVGAFTGNSSLVGVNPGFVAPLDASNTAPTTGGDYRLASLGAAIDAGNNALLPSGVTLDLDRNPRRVDDTAVADTGVGTAPIVDIGAYERQTSSQPPEVQVSPNSLTLNETGETVGNVVFRLSQAPPTNVTIQLTFNGNVQVNAGSGFGASPQTVTLTPANAVTGVTVQVRAVDDAIDEPSPHAGNVTTAATSSTTAAFNGLAVPDIAVAIIDNDTAGVTVSQSGGSTAVTEGGAGDSYTVVLASQPTANVTVNIAFDAAQLIVNGDTDGTTSLVFTPASWNVAQAVSVFAVDDTVLESNPHTTTIVQSVTSTDGNYNGIGAAPVTVTITENDLASITLQGTASTVAETAGQANLTARLALVTNGTPGGTLSSALSAQVVLTPGTAGQGVDYSQATVNVSFPAGSAHNATLPIAVDIINDRLLEAAETFTVGLERTAGNGTVSGTHVVTITDDESGVFTFSQASGSTSEAAGTYNRSASLTITGSGIGTAFRIQDAASVALLSTPGTATTPADYTLSTTRLDVPANAASPLDLAFEAAIVNDAIDEPNETFTIGFGAVTGPGSLQATGTHVVTIVDDDTAGVVITESSGTANDNNITVTEGGAGASFAVVLTSQPTSEVQVSMTFNGTIIQVGSPTLGGPPVILSFTSANWNVPQVVNVGAVNDGVAANVGSTNLSLVVGSADPNYVAIPTQPASPIVVRIIEDDVPGVTVTESGGSTAVTEGGATDTYTLVLTSQPSSNVTVTVTPDAQVTVSPSGLTFTPTNWNVAQTVTVAAVDDGIVEGPDTGTVTHAVTSADANYNGLTVAPVAVSITDNDSAVVSFAPATVSQSEATSPMAFSVTLSHPVASGVTVTVNSASGTASSPADFTAISNQTVTFAPNSTASQTVNVTIANDALDEDDESFTLTLSGLTATGDVTLPAGTATATGTILDDDALPVLSVANVTQPEGNATNTLTFTVNLSPVSGRTVSLTRATVDGSAVSIGPSPDFVAIPAGVVTIPAGQSSVEIPVTINGDTVFEGDEQFTLSLTAVTNATPGSLSATATLTDDDQQPTTTTITSDLPDPSVVGQPYPVAVEVRAQTLSPLGTVSISDGTGASCSAPLTAGTGALSTMSCTLTSTSAGTKTLTATYAPANTAFGASSGTESHRVDPAATTLALVGPATVRFNTPASYTATLAVSAPGAGTPAGIVTVSSGAQSCTITLPTATPGCTLSFPTLGSRTVTAAFVPANGDFLAASSNPVQTLAFASTDLVVSKDNGLTSYQPNDLLVYTVEVENRGPDGAPGVRILDPVPAGLTNVAWTCVAQGGAICPSAGGAGGLDVVVQTMPSGSRLVYTYYGNVQGSVPEIVNVARVELPANGTLDDPAPGNNSATDIDRLELLFANGFEPSPVNGPSGAVPLPAIELRGLGGRVAWPLLDLGDRSGLAVRVYVRALDDTVEYALATRDGDGRLRLGPWQRFAATPTLRWTAEEDRGGWRVTSARLD